MTTETITSWLTGRLPEDWFTEAPAVTVDREEVLVVGRIPAPDAADTVDDSDSDSDSDGDGGDGRAAEEGRIARFREDTRQARMRIADETEARDGRKVAWGAVCGETRVVFTSLSVPVMTRLRQPERRVLDTLVDSGVARSRSDALGWCVKLVGTHQEEWISQLRSALVAVEEARAAGPA